MVQPTGVLEVREIVVPLDLQITKFNNATPTDGTEFAITDVRLNSEPVTATPKQEDFAIAQFTDMSDADKVSAPSYELFDAGVRVGDVPLQQREGRAPHDRVRHQDHRRLPAGIPRGR